MQKVVGNKLYVFDLTPFEITEGTDKEIIYVQFECLDGYKELNASIADKMQGFNQFLACVTKPDWAQENPGPTPPEPQPETYKLTLSGTITNYDCASIFIAQEQVEKQEEYDLEEGTIVEIFPTQDSSHYTVVQGSDVLNWDEESESDPHWWMQMPAEDVTIEIDFNPEPQTVTNTFVVNSTYDENPLGGDNIWDSTDAEWAKNLDYYDATYADGYFEITLAVGHDYNIFNATIDNLQLDSDGSTIGEQNDDHYDFTMPDETVLCTVEDETPVVGVTYNVEDTSEPLKIYGWPDNEFESNVPDRMFVDGVEETVSNTYQFDSTGDHEIEYIFNDGCFDISVNNIGIESSFNSIYVTYVWVGDYITSVADYAWGIKAGNEPGASSAQPLALYYNTTVPPTINSTGASAAEAPEAPVYVPADSVTAYQQAPVWSDIASLITAQNQ